MFWDEVFIVRNMVKKENLDVWPLVSHFLIFRPDAICHQEPIPIQCSTSGNDSRKICGSLI